MNQKGFTLVEILAAVTLLAVVSGLAIAGYVRYVDYAKKEAYDTLAKSVSVAAEDYVMTHPDVASKAIEETSEDGTIKYTINEDAAEKILIKDLIEEGYLNDASDPNNKSQNCNGQVMVGIVSFEEKETLDNYIYTVDICCTNHKERTNYTIKKQNEKIISIEEKRTDNVECPS